MLSLFQNGKTKKRSQVVAIDLGMRTTKAVHIQRSGDRFEMVRYALMDAPIFEKGPTAELLGEHLKGVANEMSARGKPVVLALGAGEALLRHAEAPLIPVPDMRLMLRYNSKNYLQQDLPDYIFDCHLLGTVAKQGADAPKTNPKCRVLVGGAKKQVLDMLQAAGKIAGLNVEQVCPSLIAPANAFEYAEPQAFAKEIVALVDVGFKNTTISVLNNGELSLSRVVGIGGDKLTSGLAESLGISYAEADGLKVGLPDEVQTAMQSLLLPLGRELRASIDFFEHQQDRTVGKIFMSGGSSTSQFIVDNLQAELMISCQRWNPASFLAMALSPAQLGGVEQVSPQLVIAIGAAMAAF